MQQRRFPTRFLCDATGFPRESGGSSRRQYSSSATARERAGPAARSQGVESHPTSQSVRPSRDRLPETQMGGAISGQRRYKAKVDNEVNQQLQNTNDIIRMQEELEKEYYIPLEIMVAHFTPSSFPLVPTISKRTVLLLEKSWEKINARDATDEFGTVTPGMIVFYSEFYERLEIFDNSGSFDAILGKGATSENKIVAKGAILIRIVQYILQIEGDSKRVQTSLYMLGKSHSRKGIRPWQYSVFVQTLLLTVASRLGSDATGDVMEAWVNMFAFVMKSMLPMAIKGQVIETELNINTSSVFADEKIHQQVLEMEEFKRVEKKMRKGSDAESSRSDALARRG